MRGARAVHIGKQKNALWLESAPGDSPNLFMAGRWGPHGLSPPYFCYS
jgi:hypothetical protein